MKILKKKAKSPIAVISTGELVAGKGGTLLTCKSCGQIFSSNHMVEGEALKEILNNYMQHLQNKHNLVCMGTFSALQNGELAPYLQDLEQFMGKIVESLTIVAFLENLVVTNSLSDSPLFKKAKWIIEAMGEFVDEVEEVIESENIPENPDEEPIEEQNQEQEPTD